MELNYISNVIDMHLGNKNMTYKDVGLRVANNIFVILEMKLRWLLEGYAIGRAYERACGGGEDTIRVI